MKRPITTAAILAAALVSFAAADTITNPGLRRPAERSEARSTEGARVTFRNSLPRRSTPDRAASPDARLREALNLDLDNWIHQSAHAAGSLHLFHGDIENHLEVARFLVSTQFLDRDSKRSRPFDGAWLLQDHLEFPAFDEGAHGQNIAILSLIKERYGNLNFKDRNNRERSIVACLWDAVRCAYASQFTDGGHFPDEIYWDGIPGPWPQSPGWNHRDHRGRVCATFPWLAGYRTFNDGVTSTMVEGLLVFHLLVSEDNGRVAERVLLAGEGTWAIQQQNGGALPEQCDRMGVPVWGRHFEPPALSSRATGYALSIYKMCHALTGDAKWLQRARDTERWLQLHRLGPAGWERYLERHTLRPVFGVDWRIVYDRSEFRFPDGRVVPIEQGPVYPLARWNAYRAAVLYR